MGGMGNVYTKAGCYCVAIGLIVETQMVFLLAAWELKTISPGWPEGSPSLWWPDSGNTVTENLLLMPAVTL